MRTAKGPNQEQEEKGVCDSSLEKVDRKKGDGEHIKKDRRQQELR